MDETSFIEGAGERDHLFSRKSFDENRADAYDLERLSLSSGEDASNDDSFFLSRKPLQESWIYIKNMYMAVRNLAVSVVIFGFLTILMRKYIPFNDLCPVFYYLLVGYWAWLSLLILGGQLMHLYFYS